MDHQNIIVDPQFVVFACGPPEILHGPLGSMWTPVENHCSRSSYSEECDSEDLFSPGSGLCEASG